jgi:hypothetical protein
MNTEKKGLMKLGYVNNIKTYMSELQKQLEGTSIVAKKPDIDRAIDAQLQNKTIKYLNKLGYHEDRMGETITNANAAYIVFSTNYKNKDNNEIFGWFYKERLDRNYAGVQFGTQNDLKKCIDNKSLFTMGEFFFENWNDGCNFLDDLASNTIPEKWTYQHHKSKMPHPILKSYVENIYIKLKTEIGKTINSDDNKYIIFNSNLLDKYFHEIFLLAEVVDRNHMPSCKNLRRIKSLKDLIDLPFIVNGSSISPDQLPRKPEFFKDINEVIFQTTWTIDRSFGEFEHIIEERRDRFPMGYQNKKTDELARFLDNAINYAVSIAERNYKFIVPQYKPSDNKIQLLMPIYLSGSFTEKPDFALVLDAINNNKIYIPQTILPLDAAYQNARLIAKPDEYWLNPDKI